ncbi:MAG: acyl-CoA dehydrogenase family protein [Planctomycetota bacterium]|jgi:glutaryl-CoA dehydrogenase
MTRYKGVDFYKLDDLFTEEERMARDTIREWVDAEFMPVVEEHYRNGTFPMDTIPQLAELGVMGASLQGYGCAGMSPVAYGLILQELERGDSGLRSFVSVQGSLSMYPIHAYGSDEQKEKYLPGMAAGKLVGCFGLTEADYGSDPGGMLTNAKDDGDSYILNGSKFWITNGCIADLAVVWAKLRGEVRGFIVDKGTPGFSTNTIKNKSSLRASVTSELVFEDCRIPKTNILPNVAGLRGPLGCLNQARFGIAFGALGSAMAVYDEALRYSQSRIQFDRPIGRFQLVQRKLVWMINEITKGQLQAWRMGRMKEAGTLHHSQVSLAKRNSCWVALECGRLCRDILGANGITDEYQVMRHMCNMESVITYEGTHDIHTLIVGREITGLDAFQ